MLLSPVTLELSGIPAAAAEACQTVMIRWAKLLNYARRVNRSAFQRPG